MTRTIIPILFGVSTAITAFHQAESVVELLVLWTIIGLALGAWLKQEREGR